MSNAAHVKIRCRKIVESDIGAVIDLLARGFPERARQYWTQGLERQRDRAIPHEYPTYGYLLEADGKPVGVVLLLFAPADAAGHNATRCNLSSWYVDEAYRSHASLLISFALRHKEVTYLNISPARHTWSIVEAHGFACYSHGQFLAVPALSSAAPGVEVQVVQPGISAEALASIPERDLLIAHASYGCMSLVCTAANGVHPFIFAPLTISKGPLHLPGMQLVFCRDLTEFVSLAGALGRFLLKRKKLFVAMDANAAVGGLVGLYRESRGRKYYKGSNPPRLGDLAYTELALFGP